MHINLLRGGHGRTGTIISIMIGILFNMNSNFIKIFVVIKRKLFIFLSFHTGSEALAMTSRLHDQRKRTNGISSPETKRKFIGFISTHFVNIICLAQLEQVRFILDEMYRKKT